MSSFLQFDKAEFQYTNKYWVEALAGTMMNTKNELWCPLGYKKVNIKMEESGLGKYVKVQGDCIMSERN